LELTRGRRPLRGPRLRRRSTNVRRLFIPDDFDAATKGERSFRL